MNNYYIFYINNYTLFLAELRAKKEQERAKKYTSAQLRSTMTLREMLESGLQKNYTTSVKLLLLLLQSEPVANKVTYQHKIQSG